MVERANPAIAWPVRDAPVAVTAPRWAGWVSSRVERSLPPEFELTAPPSIEVEVQDDEQVELRWSIPRGLAQVEARLHLPTIAGLPIWRLRVEGQAWLSQRRRFARVAVVQHAVLVADEAPEDVTLLDIGEGGLRCVSHAESISLHDRVDTLLALVSPPVSSEAEVVRIEDGPRGAVVLGLRFIGLGLRDADRLRRFVFAEQSRQRSRE